MMNERVRCVTEHMKREGLTQIIVSAPASVYYLTEAKVAPGERMLALLLRDDGSMTLYANRLFALTGTVSVDLVEYDDTDDCVAILAKAVAPGKIGIDKTWPSQFTIRLMEACPGVTPVLGSAPVDKARMVKTAEEIERMRTSSRANDECLRRTIERVRPGMTESDVAAIYSDIGLTLGASGNSFDALICFGPNCAEPHHETDRTVLRSGDSVILDVGLLVNGYCSDMTRTIFVGEPTEEQRKVYEIVKAANEAGRAAVRPGVPMKEFDRAARKVIEDAGYGEYFIHRTGHGIGLEVHEFPDNSAVCETIAQPGMTFSVEPGIYLPGKFGVRIEDLVVVTENGCETLNSLPRDLLTI